MIIQELVAKLGFDLDTATLKRADQALKALRSGYLAIGAAATAAVGFLAHAASSVVETASEAEKAAARIGINTDAWQELRHAANLAELSTADLETGLRMLNKSIGQVGQGSSELSDTFRQLGISLKTDTGSLRTADEVLAEVATRFQTLPNGVEKTNLALQLFGRSGTQLIPFLNRGASGIAELRNQVRSAGLVIDQEGRQAAEEWEQAVKKLGLVLNGLKTTVGVAVVKAVVRFGMALNSGLKLIEQAIKRWRDAWKITVPIILAGITALIAANASLIGWFVAVRVAAIRAALQTVAAWVVAAAPFVALAAAIAFVILVIDDLLGFLDGADSLIGELGPKVTAWLDTVLAPSGEDPWWLAALKTFGRLVTDLQGEFPKIVSYWQSVWTMFLQWITDSVVSLGRTLTNSLTQGAKGLVESLPFGSQLSTAIFGNGQTPAASATSSVTNAQSSKVFNGGPTDIQFTIVASPDHDPKALAEIIRQKIIDHQTEEFRAAFAAVDQ